MLASGLVEAIRARVPGARFEGIAGPRMLAAGCETLYPMERLSVMGLAEVVGRYLELIPVRRRLARRFIDNPPDAFIGVDAPDFNLPLELALRPRGREDRSFRQSIGLGMETLPARKDRAGGAHDACAVSVRAPALRSALHPGAVRGPPARRRDRDAYKPGRGPDTAGSRHAKPESWPFFPGAG